MKKFLLILCSIYVMAACSQNPKARTNSDPYYDSFFEKARFIMSSEEIEIYKHLPDNKAKEEFIEEFWKKRDPNPETDENEVKQEFEERIAYANRYFNERKAQRRGWDTERGRILLQLGFPDERQWGEIPDINRSMGPTYGRLMSTKRIPLERWIYYRYQLFLEFIGDAAGFGTFKLRWIPSNLRTALDLARARLDLGSKKETRNYFKFDADFQNDQLVITIPVKRISFEEKDDRMNAEFRVEIEVYHDFQKIKNIIEDKTVSKNKEELLESKHIEFAIPYSPDQKGEYFFDILLTDKLSASKYRNFCKYKF